MDPTWNRALMAECGNERDRTERRPKQQPGDTTWWMGR